MKILLFYSNWILFALAVYLGGGPAHAGIKEGAAALAIGNGTMAVKELTPLAEEGDPLALGLLSRVYWSPFTDLPVNLPLAFTYAKRALPGLIKEAEAGNGDAQSILSFIYREGTGIEIDCAKSVEWAKRSAIQNNANGMSALGYMLAGGKCLSKDNQQAAYLYSKAAEQGNADGQVGIAYMYMLGEGVPMNIQAAYFWMLLASWQNDPNAQKSKIIIWMESNMTPSQRFEVVTTAREWKPIFSADKNHSSSTGSNKELPKTSSPEQKNAKSTGTAWAITRTQLVTNAHVVDGCGRLEVRGLGRVKIQVIDSRSDLALLEVVNNPNVAKLRGTRLRQGDAVTVIGYPLAGLLASGANVTAGNVSALAGMQNDIRHIQISAPVQPGNSGGPLLDASGHVVGVVVSKLNAMKVARATGDIPQNVNFAVSLFTLQGFLEANGVNYATAPSNKNMPTADVAEIGKRFTVLLECYK